MTIGFAFLAGLLSILAPCVLPLVPIVVGAAIAQHRYGPLALVAGLTLSFLTIGLIVASFGLAIGLDDTVLRAAGAALLILFGAVMLVPKFQAQLATATGPAVNWTERRLTGPMTQGLAGQFLVGLLLGVVWTPCVGPTLGAASVFASQGENLIKVTFVMAAFSIGSALPLLVLGLVSRQTFIRLRGSLSTAGNTGKVVLGIALVGVGILVLTGEDRTVQTALLERLPLWMIELSARY